LILDAIRKRWPWVKHLFADGAYDRAQPKDKAAFLEFTVAVVRRIEGTEGFHVLPRRWVVERTFSWMTRWRRLVREQRTACRCLAGHDPYCPRLPPHQAYTH
jgi:transposase